MKEAPLRSGRAFDERISAAIAQARAQWPAMQVSDEAFAAHVAERRLPAEPDDSKSSATGPSEGPVHLVDLALACACARGDTAAIEAFEAAYFGEVDAAGAALRCPLGQVDDAKQLLRERLFVSAAGRPPKIASYGGVGELRYWVRVIATRTLLNMGRQRKGLAEDTLLSSYPDRADNPELMYLKRLYRREFSEAFGIALRGLSVRERGLLRYTIAEGLDAQAVAAIYGVHRATVNRWLGDARATLLRSVQQELRQRLHVSAAEPSGDLARRRGDGSRGSAGRGLRQKARFASISCAGSAQPVSLGTRHHPRSPRC